MHNIISSCGSWSGIGNDSGHAIGLLNRNAYAFRSKNNVISSYASWSGIGNDSGRNAYAFRSKKTEIFCAAA
jgi:hypothetical protein